MHDLSDQKLDDLLRREFAKTPPDNGFSARVMRALPPRANQRPWLAPVAVIIGCVLAWLALLPAPLWQQATYEWISGDIGPTSVIVAALLLGAGLLSSGWALDETA